jgi:Family of unknown function (DUF6448)
MPPHCDAIDGPVVRAALKALEAEDVSIILPYVQRQDEAEVTRAFQRVVPLRKNGALAREVAELHFFETVVRVHRAGEGEPYTGLKPAGLSVGPVIPVAENAIETGSADQLVNTLTGMVEQAVREKFTRMTELQAQSNRSADDAREYVEAMLGLQVWSHKLYLAIQAAPHERGAAHAEVH